MVEISYGRYQLQLPDSRGSLVDLAPSGVEPFCLLRGR
jgi:hypothetical protein